MSYADERLLEFRLEVDRAWRTPSEAVACQHRERAMALALELDRWLTGGNEPPADWCAAFLRATADGTVSALNVRVAAAQRVREDAPLGAACANQPSSALPD